MSGAQHLSAWPPSSAVPGMLLFDTTNDATPAGLVQWPAVVGQAPAQDVTTALATGPPTAELVPLVPPPPPQRPGGAVAHHSLEPPPFAFAPPTSAPPPHQHLSAYDDHHREFSRYPTAAAAAPIYLANHPPSAPYVYQPQFVLPAGVPYVANHQTAAPHHLHMSGARRGGAGSGRRGGGPGGKMRSSLPTTAHHAPAPPRAALPAGNLDPVSPLPPPLANAVGPAGGPATGRDGDGYGGQLGAAAGGARQLIVNFLDPEATSADLHAAFSVIGPLQGARVIHDARTSASRRYGFVYFVFPEDAERAMQCMNGHPIRGRRVKVSWAQNQNVASHFVHYGTPATFTAGQQQQQQQQLQQQQYQQTPNAPGSVGGSVAPLPPPPPRPTTSEE